VTLAEVQENLGWEVRQRPALDATAPPTPEELRLLRDELDPRRLYL
jgi:glutaconate CoA-transferase subunit B